jgi:hypothetical protein
VVLSCSCSRCLSPEITGLTDLATDVTPGLSEFTTEIVIICCGSVLSAVVTTSFAGLTAEEAESLSCARLV